MESEERDHEAVAVRDGAGEGRTACHRVAVGGVHQLEAERDEILDRADDLSLVARRDGASAQPPGGAKDPAPIALGGERAHRVAELLDPGRDRIAGVSADELGEIPGDARAGRTLGARSAESSSPCSESQVRYRPYPFITLRMRFGVQRAATPPSAKMSPGSCAAAQACRSASGHCGSGRQRLGAGPRPLRRVVVIAIVAPATVEEPVDDLTVALHGDDALELGVYRTVVSRFLWPRSFCTVS